ncbi:hypothetical protein BD289DRAFT_379809 [Coniella lustricola]|uniref:Iron-sulfur assembly protein 1 n=1 Tax=Coniella lustricola TaxID=2025994 RepID=A0A2T2ZS71_9PEZI|nr:hypothetical protein BD289DRAFT_379809 [Coniella lustricola]
MSASTTTAARRLAATVAFSSSSSASSSASTICFSCRRSLLRHFSSAGARRAYPEFQSYRLVPPQPLSTGVTGADSSIVVDPPLPRVHETRPPPSQHKAFGAEAASMIRGGGGGGGAMPQFTESLASTQTHKTSTPTSTATAPTTTSSAVPTEQAKASSTTPSPVSSAPPSPPPTSTTTATPRPRSRLRAPRKAAMKLTPAAVEQLRARLDSPDPRLIRVGVRNRGCSGLAYHLEYVDKAGPFDETVEQDGVKVLIDSKALFSIIGSEMDWVEDKLNERFTFRNPNIKEQCGCGESFMV